jgi:hypothetical protein
VVHDWGLFVIGLTAGIPLGVLTERYVVQPLAYLLRRNGR